MQEFRQLTFALPAQSNLVMGVMCTVLVRM